MDNGPPHYIHSKHGEVVVADVDYQTWSIHCKRTYRIIGVFG
jgi:hypothetical protein